MLVPRSASHCNMINFLLSSFCTIFKFLDGFFSAWRNTQRRSLGSYSHQLQDKVVIIILQPLDHQWREKQVRTNRMDCTGLDWGEAMRPHLVRSVLLQYQANLSLVEL